MRVLLDTCVPPRVRDELRAAGHEVIWSGDWPRDPGDAEILRLAVRESRVVVTLDKDFGEIAITQAVEHAGIFRIVGFRVGEHAAVCWECRSRYAGDLSKGAIVTAEPRRVRVRPGSTGS